MTSAIRSFAFAILVGLSLTSASPVAAAGAVDAFPLTIEGSAHLRLEACLSLAEGDRSLLYATIDNAGDVEVDAFSVILRGPSGETITTRRYGTLLPGDTKAFAVRLSDGLIAEAGYAGTSGTICG